MYVGAAIALPRSSDEKPSDGSQSYPERPHNQNAYLQVKWAQDTLARQKAAEGMPVVVGIPSMTFGEYDPGNTTGSFVIEMANRTLPVTSPESGTSSMRETLGAGLYGSVRMGILVSAILFVERI